MYQINGIGIIYMVNATAIGVSHQEPLMFISEELEGLANYCQPDWKETLIADLNNFNAKYLEFEEIKKKGPQKCMQDINNILLDESLAPEVQIARIRDAMNQNQNNNNDGRFDAMNIRGAMNQNNNNANVNQIVGNQNDSANQNENASQNDMDIDVDSDYHMNDID